MAVHFSETPYIIVRRPPVVGAADVFISFKDPEDDQLSLLVKELLARAGFRGYRAKDDPRPGVSYWDEKIEPAIRSSRTTIVLWTIRAQNDPREVLREVRLSRQYHKYDVLMLEDGTGVRAPPEFPPDVIEHIKFSKDEPWILVAPAIAALAKRWQEGGL